MLKKDRLCLCIMALLVLAGLFRITLTYSALSQTWDEPAHIAAGMEWLEKRQYTFESQHPPLARVFDALGLYLDGDKLSGAQWMYDEGNNLLHHNHDYDRNLILARLGVLPFFIMGCIVVWIWAKRSFGITVALVSVFFVSTLPPVLAHAGIATTDMAAAATLAVALYALFVWLQRPTFSVSILLGIAIAASILTKFSNIPFFLLGSVSIVGLYLVAREREKDEGIQYSPRTLTTTITLCSCMIGIWAGYLFSMGPWKGVMVPAPEFFSGIQEVAEHNKEGHLAYLLGQTYMQGRFIFFPVAVGVKTPVPFLLLSLAGLAALFQKAFKDRKQSALLAAPVAGLCVLVVGIVSNLNLGIRHILAMYLFLAPAAGFATVFFWNFRKSRVICRVALIVLLSGQLISSLSAHPDYLAYYNFIGGKHPEEIVLDTTDWGQDARQLGVVLKQRGITHFSICYYGSADLDRLGLPPRQKLEPYKKVTGWVAASLLCNKMGAWEPPYDHFAWLDRYQPVAMAGKSIRLYYIPRESGPSTTRNQ
jgi:hypothetical protein